MAESIVFDRPSSELRREVVNGRPVYHKTYLQGDWGRTSEVVRARTAREVQLLDRLKASGLFRRRLGVLRVIEASPELASLMTLEVPGEPLEMRLSSSHQGRVLLAPLYLAGRWLRLFQGVELTATDRRPISRLDPASISEYCRLRLESLGTDYSFRWPSPNLLSNLLKRLDDLVAQSDDEDRNLVWSHADYAPCNIIWDGNKLTPIDFGMAQADRPLQDVTYFIHRLEMQLIYRPWKRWPISTWTQAFLRGYGRSEASKTAMYEALMIRHLICRLHTYVRRPPRSFKQRLHDGWVRQVLKRRLTALSDR